MVFAKITKSSLSQLVVMISAAPIILLTTKGLHPTAHWTKSSTSWSTLTTGTRAWTSVKMPYSLFLADAFK